jgi:cation:H+ antiporter
MRIDVALFFSFILVAAGAVALRAAGVHFEPVTGALAFGFAIVCCAFLMGTAAELAQLDVSESLALIVVALLAVLPEYAVDLYFAYRAGDDATYAPYALANMTGANRLLIGLGWPCIAFVWWLRSRQRTIHLEPSHGGGVFFLALATIYSLWIPLKGTLSLLDTAILVLLFVLYVRFARAQPAEAPELVGPAEVLARHTRAGTRRLVTVAVFAVAAAGIFASSEPFAESLLGCGAQLGIDRYYLVQWLAPLASESPEFLVAGLLVWKRRPTAGFGTLLSSKLNQWTLLVGAIPVAYGVSLLVHGHGLTPLHIDERQAGELLLTVAQSWFGVCILMNRDFKLSEAAWVAALFLAQIGTAIALERAQPADLAYWMLVEKLAFSAFYLLVGTVYLVRYRRYVPELTRVAFPGRPAR